MPEETFGDRPLINRALRPVSESERKLGVTSIAALWCPLALGPWLYSFMWKHQAFSRELTLLILFVVMGLVFTLALALGRGPARFGIGLLGLMRACFGTEGAKIPLLLVWVVGCIWAADQSLAIALWVRKMILSALPQVQATDVSLLEKALHWHLPIEEGISLFSWMMAAALILAAARICRGGIKGVARWAWLGAGAALTILAGLMLHAYRSVDTFTPRHAPTSVDALAALEAIGFEIVLLCLPVLMTVPDWGRSVQRQTMRPSRLLPWLLIPVALGIAVVGEALGGAAFHVLGRTTGMVIPDAVGWGGLVAGLSAALHATCLWLMAAPLVALYTPSLVLSAMSPRKRSFATGITYTSIAIILGMPTILALDATGFKVERSALLVLPVLGILLADEFIVRRGKLMLEELYLHRGVYGGWFGVHWPGLLALLGALAGIALVEFSPRYHPPSPWNWLAKLARPDESLLPWTVAGPVFYLLLVALKIWLVRPVLHALAAAWGALRSLFRRRQPPRWTRATGDEETNPDFKYPKK